MAVVHHPTDVRSPRPFLAAAAALLAVVAAWGVLQFTGSSPTESSSTTTTPTVQRADIWEIERRVTAPPPSHADPLEQRVRNGAFD